ncbi:hypothetical protein ACWGI8_26850 [Streptomyces sp. NPDC054841]
MSTTPTVNGQVIGQAHYATRAVLERVLARTGTTFEQSVALNATATVGEGDAGEGVERARLIDRMTGTLKIDEAAVLAVIAELTSAQLLETAAGDDAVLRLTDAGASLNRTIRASVGEITARLYADLPADDLAAAGRVLAVVTERANAELTVG